MEEKVSRRYLLQQSAAFGALFVFGATACGKKAAAIVCTDVSSLSPTDAQVRATLGYMDSSTEPGKMCSSCQQFNAPATAGVCGTCKVVKGPINPLGYCKSFVAKAT